MANTLKDQIGLKQQDSHTYTAGYNAEWAMGPMLHGGCVAAVVYSAAQPHFTTTLASQRQPDVHTLHIEFFRPCNLAISTIRVSDTKVGKGSSYIQLALSQMGELKCVALATPTDFSTAAEPTAIPDLGFSPAPRPTPDFTKVEAFQPDENWIPSKTDGELFAFIGRMTYLYPENGNPTDGIVDYWASFDRPEVMDGAHLALLSDCAPSMSDTLLRTEGLFDAHRICRVKKEVAEKTPGQLAILKNSVKDAAKARIWNTTLSMDMQFKRRMPEEEMTWTFTRTTTRMLEGGRMDLDLVICDQNLAPLCLARQVMLVIDASRRWRKNDANKATKL